MKRLAPLLIASFILSLSACSRAPKHIEPPKPPPASIDAVEPKEERLLEHEVLFYGETLGLISLWYTGSSNWKPLLDSSPGIEPQSLQLGDIVLIPGSLVVNEEPLPASFVTKRNKTREVVVAPKKRPMKVPLKVVTSKPLPARTPTREKVLVHPSPTTTSLPSPSTIKRVRARFFQRIRTGKY